MQSPQNKLHKRWVAKEDVQADNCCLHGILWESEGRLGSLGASLENSKKSLNMAERWLQCGSTNWGKDPRRNKEPIHLPCQATSIPS